MIPLSDDAPLERIPIVTIALVVGIVLAFLWQVDVGSLADALGSNGIGELVAARIAETVRRGGVVPYELLTLEDRYPRALVPPPLTVLTGMFLHGGLVHVGSNLLFLWIFGNNVEDALGRVRFLLYYLGCGVAAALVHVVASAATGADIEVPMVGASGAIAGVLAAYLVLFPRARVTTLVLVRVVRVPAALFIGLWFLLQVLSILLGAGGGGVAFFAHVGGFVTGWLAIRRVGRHPAWRARHVRW